MTDPNTTHVLTAPAVLTITNTDGRVLLRIHQDGAVEGDPLEAGSAADIFVREVSRLMGIGHYAQIATLNPGDRVLLTFTNDLPLNEAEDTITFLRERFADVEFIVASGATAVVQPKEPTDG